MQTVEKIKQYIQVQEDLATAGQPTLRDLENLADAGYQVVINLGLHETDYALSNEPTWVEQLGMKYIHIPVDFNKPARNDFIRFLNTVNIEQGKKLFIHCAENKRVSVFVALYLVTSGQLTQTEGWNLILRAWEPNLVWESYYYDVLNHVYQIQDEAD